MNEFDEQEIIVAWYRILTGLGIDVLDENFRDTPRRIAKMYREVFAGLLEPNLVELEDHLTKTFPCSYDQMIVEKGIEAWSTCPHHFLPVGYQVDFGYLPSNRVLGISKPVRVIQLLAKRPVLQEQLTQDIVDYVERTIRPRGVMVRVTGEHHCMICRGVKAHAKVIMTGLTGAFKEAPVKEEFLAALL